MDTDNVGPNLSGDQFRYAYFKDHHDRLGLAEPQVGAILGLEPDPEHYVQATGRKTTFGAQEELIPNQTHVNVDKVAEYVQKPSKKPISVVKNPETGQTHVLDGHHRLVASRLRGEPVRAEYWEYKK